MGGVDPSRSDTALPKLLFSTLIQAVEADHKWTCQVHKQMTSAKKETGRYVNLYLFFFFFFFPSANAAIYLF